MVEGILECLVLAQAFLVCMLLLSVGVVLKLLGFAFFVAVFGTTLEAVPSSTSSAVKDLHATNAILVSCNRVLWKLLSNVFFQGVIIDVLDLSARSK